MKDIAVITRVESLTGALFQIALAHDCAMDLKNNEHSKDAQQQLADRMSRLRYSAAGVIRREAANAADDLSVRYMPISHDPVVIFDKARKAA